MDNCSRFQDEIFQELKDLKDRVRNVTFEQFVDDAARCGITVDELIEVSKGCSGEEFLARITDLVTKRGAVVKDSTR